jgi:hypothetical protein
MDKVFVVFCFSLLSCSLSSQNDSLKWHDRISFSSSLGISKVSSPFDRKYDRTPFSLSFNLGIKPIHSKYRFITLNINYQRFAQFSNIYTVQVQQNIVDINHTTRSNALFFDLGYRHEFDQFWYLIPNAGFSLGFSNAYVYTSIRDNFTNEIIETFREASDWSFAYIVRGGIKVPIVSGVHSSFSVSYIQTGSMEVYLPSREPVLPVPVDPFGNFDRRRTSLNLLAFEIGVTLYLAQIY